jgi:hypothetical protein
MLEKVISKLLSAKFIIAIMVMVTTCYLVISGKLPSEQFIPLATLIVGFYYGQSVAKKV